VVTHRLRAEGAESRCLVRSEPKPKGLLRSAGRSTGVIRIKTDDALLEMISQLGAMPLDMRLPRETRSEPRCRERNRRWRNSHHNKNLTAPYLRVQTSWIRPEWVLTGNCSPQRILGIQIGGMPVYMELPPTFFEHLGEQKGITKAFVLRDRNDAFVFLFRVQASACPAVVSCDSGITN
jgi:hypothetical protein